MITLSETDVRTCEACWQEPVAAVRTVRDGPRALLCIDCALGNAPCRVDLFPPFGVYRLTGRRVDMGRHAGGRPQTPPNPGPPLPYPAPTPSPPGTPPV
ncbi:MULTISPECIES: hypothetical protein [Streptomyces]|uniref:Uncharacterized protein n=1 Tax=Streptomyces flavovirens TaxID=52258 RepID=A0ABV8NEF1_9ACTN|nr:hypothetical protein [Streptomyces sp. MBT51]